MYHRSVLRCGAESPAVGCSDSAVKQILLTMNEKDSFIIEDLDDHHVVIKADEEWKVRRELEAELEKNTYSLE
ncbi:hypothetical protein CERSUDRAFT_51929 [Gelatoporia subvermispora B]|uniref:General transcription and DNA repair factor IIH subunit TFB5 n=1 Tax=Ceriporiopsis subvermispora (strain B) TaxID=914234 RepID=M2QGI9_CERS8|nr:hypothetical protein CERSUDRAFT_51929 [Gelatoporia subvermispora B]